MNTVYTCESMLSILDSMVATIAPEMPRHISRWGGTVNEWEQNVQRLRDFIETRCTLLDDGMVDCFDLTGPYNLTLLVEPAGAGEIELNTLDIESFPWSGNYFGNMENLVKAKPNDPALPFLEWRSSAGHVIFPDNKTEDARIVLEGVDTLVAVFGLPNQTVEIESGLSFSAYPTITNDELTLEYELDEPMDVEVSLYNIVGRKVAGFSEASGQRAAGQFAYPLNLISRDVTPGIYFLNFKAGQQQGSIKVVIAR